MHTWVRRGLEALPSRLRAGFPGSPASTPARSREGSASGGLHWPDFRAGSLKGFCRFCTILTILTQGYVFTEESEIDREGEREDGESPIGSVPYALLLGTGPQPRYVP